jgi:hypothetical protein
MHSKLNDQNPAHHQPGMITDHSSCKISGMGALPVSPSLTCRTAAQGGAGAAAAVPAAAAARAVQPAA